MFEDPSRELRNNILALTLIEDGDIEIKKGSWPGILVNCKQLRQEGVPIYLGNHTFLAIIEDLDKELLCWLEIPEGEGSLVNHTGKFDRSAISAWLRIVKGLPAE